MSGTPRLSLVHRLRLRRVRAAAVTAVRAAAAWARRPSGRLIVPGLIVALLLGTAGAAGAYLVPQAWRSGSSAAPPATASASTPSATASLGVPGLAESADPGPSGIPSGAPAAGRPADALAGWAQDTAARVGIPAVAVQAYGYAELVIARTLPGCRLSWTTLAAIGKVESAHGSANRAVLSPDGQAVPSIIGLPLDGQGGRQLIRDTDDGILDGDSVFDRAVGPMQFIPATWRDNAIDADNNGITDPDDIDDAAMAAGNYLCANGRDLSTSEDWWAAILSYNDVQRYAQDVFTAANDYGVRSRT